MDVFVELLVDSVAQSGGSTSTSVEVEIPVIGPQGPSNLHVGPTNELNAGVPGLWVQTGLGTNGADWTMWIEDGTA